jgi:TPR repeat protein
MPGWRMLAEYYVAQKRPADSADAFQHAVDLGDPLAMAGLARQLATGDGIAADPDRAEGLFWASIKAGNKAAWGPIGDFFLNTRHDFKAAADAYHWAAENGDTDATLSLALMEGQGKGLTANLSDAEALIDKAIAAGAGDKGWRAEGDLFRLSPGADPHRAVAAYAKAVDLGDRQSMISLAGMVSGGIGTAQDFASASNLLGKTVGLPANYAAALDAAEARANGNDAAAGNLALGYLYGLPQSPYFDAAKSTSYYGNAGAIGGGIGELMAAAAAAKSFDTAKARRLAIEHYQAAARFVGARQVAGDMINLPTPALVSLVQQMLVDRGQKIAVTGGIDRTTGKAMAALCEPAISCDPSVISIDAVSRLLDPS